MCLPLFWLMVFLCQGAWSSLGHSQSQGPAEVVIPLKITDSESGMPSSDWISYSFKFEGQRHIVHLKLIKHMVARNMPVFTYTDQGALLEDYPFIQDNCYYHGYMDEDPKSQVSLNLCFGTLQGFLQKGNTVYQIEPKVYSSTFEHLVYKLDDEDKKFPPRKCYLTNEEIQQQIKSMKNEDLSTSRQSGYRVWWTHKRYFPLGFVASKELFEYLYSNISYAVERFYFTTLIISNIYQFIDLHMVVMGVEIWTEINFVAAYVSEETLNVFCKWKEMSLNPRIIHNIVFFVVRHSNESSVSKSFPLGVCYHDRNCICTNYGYEDNPYFAAFVIAHQVGHSLGFTHDVKHCYCKDRICLMNSELRLAHRISNCTYGQFYILRLDCLHHVPPKDKLFMFGKCGNRVVDEGEDCDCGSMKACKRDPCCEANCTFTPGSVCASGLCCRSCKILPTGTVCREKENECDLPEWCNGTTNECPDDSYVQFGVPCEGGGYCSGGRCNNRDAQCKSIFGEQAKSAGLYCYTQNLRGDRFGNCGINALSYTRCPMKDILCGRIQCENVPGVPLLRNHTTYISVYTNGYNCWSVDFHAGRSDPDIGEVKDGTPCGENHYCFERQCITKVHFTKFCSPLKCNLHGICNNKHHCHCDPTTRPPYCYDVGVGGSVDSGPPPGNFSFDYEDYSTDDILHTHVCSFLVLLRTFLFLMTLIFIVLKAKSQT